MNHQNATNEPHANEATELDLENQAQEKESSNEQDNDSPTKRKIAYLGKKTLFFGLLAIIFIILYCVINIDSVSTLLHRIGQIVSPLIIGCVIAYLCNPILEFYEYRVLRRLGKSGLRRGLSLLFAVLTVIAIIALILLMVIPELIDSLSNLAGNYQLYVDSFLGFLQNLINTVSTQLELEVDIADVEELKTWLMDFFGEGADIFTSITNWIKSSGIVNDVGNTILGIFNTFKDIILGIFIALYILSSKEKRVAQVHKFRKAVFTKKQNERISEITALVNHTFNGFIFGVLIDALVVGVLTFALLSIFEVSPYNLLIATLIAVTNVIPVFGPFIGAIPAALIVLISNPSKAILFIILILVIQQIDGNLLCPKIQGDNTGISSLAVLVAITIAGSMWGILGMVIGVPICAVIIELVKRAIEKKLARIGEPTDTTAYYPADALGNAEKDVYYEHSGLRYAYEHSKLKPRVDRFKARVFSKQSREQAPPKAEKPAEVKTKTKTQAQGKKPTKTGKKKK